MAARKKSSKKSRSKSKAVARRAQGGVIADADYAPLFDDIAELITEARHRAARAVNHAMTELYGHVGRVIVEREQGGAARASYGDALRERLRYREVWRFESPFNLAVRDDVAPIVGTDGAGAMSAAGPDRASW